MILCEAGDTTYREKITETWTEMLACDEVPIGRWVAVGDLLNDAKAAGRNAGKKWITEAFPLGARRSSRSRRSSRGLSDP